MLTIPPKAWQHAIPSFTCGEHCRSPEHLTAALAQWQVATAERYRPGAGKTYCNIFVWDATCALECEVPHWITKPTGEREELNALGVIDWLRTRGADQGWRRVTGIQAVIRANLGHPVVVCWENPEHLHSSHVAMALPTPVNQMLHIAQAGAFNFFDRPYDVAEGFSNLQPLEYFTHA